MTWTCKACTFLNRQDNSHECEICSTFRENNQTTRAMLLLSSKSKPAAHKKAAPPHRQATLFGKVLTKDEEKVQMKKKSTTTTTTTAAAAATTKPATITTTMTQTRFDSSVKKMTTTMSDDNDTTNHSFPNQSCCVVSPQVPIEELAKHAKRIMKETFGIRKLRNLQPQAIKCALRRQSQIVVMATGGGKSLCYQLPAMVMGGTTIVISPLKALIADQVDALQAKKVPVAFISSVNTDRQNTIVLERLLQRRLLKATTKNKNDHPLPPVTLLYCTPEQVTTDRFRNALVEMHGQKRLAGFAVDEAHCISAWGHDFRKAYLRLGWLRERFPALPLMACTATATPKVIRDIQSTLHLQDRPCHVGSFDRTNLYYKVRYKDVLDNNISPRGGAMGDLVSFLKKQHARAQKNNIHNSQQQQSKTKCSGIVYVHKQKETMELAETITKETGIKALAYHGGMKDSERQHVQRAWTVGEAEIVIATVSFGMGIDLAHVRYVVHWNIPKDVSSFYQESGRAGRDGLPSFSLVYYSKQDASMFAYLARLRTSTKENRDASQRALDALESMVNYCLNPGCRRKYLLNHFGEVETDPSTACKQSCDFCANPDKVTKAIEGAQCASDFTFHTTSTKTETAWNGQWSSPHGDKGGEDDVEHAWATKKSGGSWTTSEGLSITGGGAAYTEGEEDEDWNQKEGTKPKANFAKASSILSKYEAIECQQNQSSGFVRFKSRDFEDGSSRRGANEPPTIPKHLLENAPDPLAHFNQSAPPETSSSDASAVVKRLRAEWEQAKAKAKREAILLGRDSGERKRAPPPPPPPPPSISFKKARQRKS